MDAIWNIWHLVKRVGIYLPCIALLAACTPQQPQRPTFHGRGYEVKTDSALLQAMELNQHLAEQADRDLTRFAAEGYAQVELGYWAKTLRVVDQPLQADERVKVQMQVFLLSGQQVEQRDEWMTVGQIECMQAVADALEQMERGEHVSLMVPWYLAYGATGNEQVPPYTNLRVELTVER